MQQVSILEWFLKDHVTLKPGVMMLKTPLWHKSFENINVLLYFWSNKCSFGEQKKLNNKLDQAVWMVEDVGLNESYSIYIFILWHYWKILDLQLLLSIKANLRNTMDTWKINSANKSYPNESESRECWQIGMCKPQLTSDHCEKTAFFEM